MFDPSTLPIKAGDLLLVTDRLAAPADFTILNILTTHLRQVNHGKTVFASISQTLSHWSSISSRLNPSANLSAHISKNSLVFLDLLTNPPVVTLKSLYKTIKQQLESSDDKDGKTSNMVLLDGLSILGWLGLSLLEIRRFIRALRHLCLENGASLIIRHHRTVEDVDDMLRTLLTQSSLHLEVLPLLSGKSGAISGEIALHSTHLSSPREKLNALRNGVAVQYHLCDTGPMFFEKGTVAAVL
ncbi:hypothetical protein PNOK_0194600 [Pyrrhoderma noxium]|uniref:Elongator complex protein 5 n=1 Tax=Pyrrhoderma noxium TaxID=2282107 RepID=A0A286UR22_9AGAM|nr:hypothetical protein PNOK_0194600 [Pyrrhoderma noxium]